MANILGLCTDPDRVPGGDTLIEYQKPVAGPPHPGYVDPPKHGPYLVDGPNHGLSIGYWDGEWTGIGLRRRPEWWSEYTLPEIKS